MLMRKNGAREVILAYLSTHRIGPGGQASRNEIRDWCVDNQHLYGVKVGYGTFKQQMGQMIIDNAKNVNEGHDDGFDNVFCSSSKGKSILTVNNPN